MGAIFLPIVKKDRKEDFFKKWGDWLCLSNSVEEEKCPGKLKVEFLTQNGEMISLCPKSYRAYDMDSATVKDGKKGIPGWFQLEMEDYYDVLYKQNPTTMARVCSLRLNKENKMTRTSLRKTGLSGIHAKRGVLSDGVSTEPLRLNGEFI